MGRGANWTSSDDVQLCKSWLHVSYDPIVGTNQKSSTFCEKIIQHIKEKNAEVMQQNPALVKEVRSQRSLQSRFTFISAAVSKFAGVYSSQQQNAASGTNEIDVERSSLEVFRSQHEGGKSFDHRECWIVLKQHEKWATQGSEPLFEPSHEAPNPDEPATPNSVPGTPAYRGFREPERQRPIGVKKAKGELLQSKVQLRQLQLAESANIMASKRQQIMQQQVALGYFKLDPSLVPVDMREIFINMRNGLLAEIQQPPNQEIPPMASGTDGDLDENSPLDDNVQEDGNSPGQNGGDGYDENIYQPFGGYGLTILVKTMGEGIRVTEVLRQVLLRALFGLTTPICKTLTSE